MGPEAAVPLLGRAVKKADDPSGRASAAGSVDQERKQES